MNVISEQKMRAECYYRQKKNIYDADKEKVHRDQTLGNTGGNNNKDAMFDWRSGCQSEDKCNCHIHLTSIMITTCFCTNREHYRLVFLFFPLVLSLLCVYYIRLQSHVVRKCLCGCSKYQNAHVWCLMNVMHSWFCDVYLYIFKKYLFFGGFCFIRYKTL